jgi:hypothetical protein
MPESSKYIWPNKIKIPGREKPELAQLSFPGSGRTLPEAGGKRPWIGREGSWWRRRVAEGSATLEGPKKSKKAAPSARKES